MTDQVLWGKICSDQNLKLAWNKVKENKGSPGVDSVTLEEFEKNLENNLNLLQKELENGDFKPIPVLRFYLNKEDGTSRPIGIPPVRDRVVQQALQLVLSPIFEEEFLDCSFAYRPGRSALEAIDKVESLINEGTKWVLDGDIEKFFDSIDHDLLLSFVARRVTEDSILKLISKFLKTGFFDNMSIHEEYFGITQGSAISPLLANIYLHNFDVEINVRAYHLIRYADDFLILEDSQESYQQAFKLEMKAIPEEKPITPLPQSVEVSKLIFSDEDVSLFSSLFKGKAGFFARQWVNEKGRRGFAPISHSLNMEDIKHHFSGNETLGLYLLNDENRVCLAVIDMDIDKKSIHRIEENMSSYFDKAGTESIITEYGLLERKRRSGNKFEWTIKL